MNKEHKRKTRNLVVRTNDAQTKFAELVASGMAQTEAARIAYPNDKFPAQRACKLMKHRGVKQLLGAYMMDNIMVEASAVPYAVLMQICKDEEASHSNRIKAGIALHDKFGLGRVKSEDGTAFRLEDMDDDQIIEFIQKTEGKLSQPMNANLLEFDVDVESTEE